MFMEQANDELRLGLDPPIIDAVNACPGLARLAVVWQSDAISDELRFLTFRFGIPYPVSLRGADSALARGGMMADSAPPVVLQGEPPPETR
jgi:hypothetical protein